MPILPAHLDFKTAVARQFASRPTLRQVIGERLRVLLFEHHPVLARVQPPLIDGDALLLVSPHPGEPHWVSQSFVDVLLQALLTGRSVQLAEVNGRRPHLALRAPYRYAEQQDNFGALQLGDLSSALDELIELAIEYFRQSQVDYWNAQGSAGVSRDEWLQLVMKTALLRNLPLQSLNARQQACIYGLLKGGTHLPIVAVVEARLSLAGQLTSVRPCNLLVSGEWDEQQVLLWCSPSSVIRAFDCLDQFTVALRDELAENHVFDTMTWDRQVLDGNVFAQQTTLMLQQMLEAFDRVRYPMLADVAELERLFEHLSDPGNGFIAGYHLEALAEIQTPPGMLGATTSDRFAFQAAVFELALNQSESEGIAALDGVLDLATYTRQQLEAQIRLDHPVHATIPTDELIVELAVARGMPGGAGVGAAGGESLEVLPSKTLTEFAIGNLVGLQGAFIKRLSRRDQQALPAWMSIDYAKTLVSKVDVGCRYPDYVAKTLDEPQARPHRVSRFAREWRISLLFSALAAKLGGKISEAGLQCVTDLCRGMFDEEAADIGLMPLLLKRQPQSTRRDLVQGMYVIFLARPSLVLLYRPLFPKDPLLEFSSAAAMMAGIVGSLELQDSLLTWMSPQVRPIYAAGGFAEPHVTSIGIDPFNLPATPEPASLASQVWLTDMDEKLYQANRDLLVDLADRQTVSNAESRWRTLAQGAWLLFDTVTLSLRGPVATVTWLVQAVAGLEHQVQALSQGSAFERSSVVVDVLLNLSMAMLHARLPSARPEHERPLRVAFTDPLAATFRVGRMGPQVAMEGRVGLMGTRFASQQDHSYRANQGFNWMPREAKQRLRALASTVVLEGRQPLASGAGKGLYEVEGKRYLWMAGCAYRVEPVEHGLRILGEQGEPGPWLRFRSGAWRIDTDLRLAGQGPKTRLEMRKKENEQKYKQLMDQESTLMQSLIAKERELHKQREQQAKVAEDIATLEGAKGERDEEQLKLLRNLHTRVRLRVLQYVEDYIATSFEHDDVVSQLAPMKQADPKMSEAIRLQRNDTRRDLIEDCNLYYNQLATLINDSNLNELVESVSVVAETPVEVAIYQRFYAGLRQVVEWQEKLVGICKRFDGLLEETLRDTSVTFTNKDGSRRNKVAWLGEIIEQRRMTGIDLEFQALMDLAEFSLNRQVDIDEKTMLAYSDYLYGEELKSAGAAHGELAGGGFTPQQQIDVLKGAIEAYEQADVMSKYLLGFGGEAVRGDVLVKYRMVLESVHEAAKDELTSLLREQDLAEPRPQRQAVYAMRGGKRRVVRTQRGRSVVGEERMVEGEQVVQQLDPQNASVLKTFKQQGGEWVEQVQDAAPPSVPPSPTIEPQVWSRRARGLLSEVDKVVRLARSYVEADEPKGLITVVEQHVEKLKRAMNRLSWSSQALREELQDSVERLESLRRDLLTAIYLSTSHPTAESLRFLLENGQVSITRTVDRQTLLEHDYLDTYEIRRRPLAGHTQGIGLWEAHFHYPDSDTPRRAFVKGHLKLWSQRRLGHEAQLRAAKVRGEFLKIYRGDLRLKDVEGLIPFD